MTLSEKIYTVLGGRPVFQRKIHEIDEFQAYIRDGFTLRALASVTQEFDLSQEDLLKPLGVSKATLTRRKKQVRLQSNESDGLFRIAWIGALAETVFGDKEKATRWLHKPNRALSGRTPLSLLDTTIGFQEVKTTLGRIEHGVYS